MTRSECRGCRTNDEDVRRSPILCRVLIRCLSEQVEGAFREDDALKPIRSDVHDRGRHSHLQENSVIERRLAHELDAGVVLPLSNGEGGGVVADAVLILGDAGDDFSRAHGCVGPSDGDPH